MNGLNEIIVTDIARIFTVSSQKGKFAKTSNRRYYGLSFCLSGQITYTHNGKEYVSDPNHAIILPKGQSYTLYGDKSGDFPVIDFDCLDFLCDTMVLIPVKNMEAVMRDFEQMKALSLFSKNRAKVFSFFYSIIDNLICENAPDPGVLTPAVEFIENNYTLNELSNSMLAELCKISEVYFRKLFQKVYKTTPRQFIIDIRINKAKQLLSDGVLSIGAVAEKCGFSNPYHFCRLFKQRTGVNPSEFMKQNKIYKI